MTDTLFISALTTLAGVIVALWKINQSNTSKIEGRADRIEKKHDLTMEEMVNVTREVGELKGRIDLAEKIHPRLDELESLSRDVLKAVNKASNK
jgi:Ni,Fe-hydrogenase maturation factor